MSGGKKDGEATPGKKANKTWMRKKKVKTTGGGKGGGLGSIIGR